MTDHEHGWYKATYAGSPTIALLNEDGWWVIGYEHPMDHTVFDDIGVLVMAPDGGLVTVADEPYLHIPANGIQGKIEFALKDIAPDATVEWNGFGYDIYGVLAGCMVTADDLVHDALRHSSTTFFMYTPEETETIGRHAAELYASGFGRENQWKKRFRWIKLIFGDV